jgi:hypothetical protein
MILIPVVDLLLLIATTVTAVMNRGTLLGWLCVLFVFWQVWNLIKFVKEHL